MSLVRSVSIVEVSMAARTEALDYHRITHLRDRFTEGNTLSKPSTAHCIALRRSCLCMVGYGREDLAAGLCTLPTGGEGLG